LEIMRKDPDAYAKKLKNVDARFVVPRIIQDPRVKVGVMGDFTDASAELGKKVAEECVSSLSAIIREIEQAKGKEHSQ
ncbi:MAG: hypothetical protein QME62_06405, partial [Armatimonadota bacterium]|nr:hypothetical protein [Armatimonadota bacterium]